MAVQGYKINNQGQIIVIGDNRIPDVSTIQSTRSVGVRAGGDLEVKERLWVKRKTS